MILSCFYCFYPSAILGRWSIVVASVISLSVCLSLSLSVYPISPSLYTWLTSNHHCIFTMPSPYTLHYCFGSLAFDLGMVTFTMTLLFTTKLPERNIPSMPKQYICCILPISQMSSKGSDLDWPLTHFSRSQWPWTLLVSPILPQQNITSMPKWYIWSVLPISQMSSDRWPTFQGQIGQQDLSVCPSNFS